MRLPRIGLSVLLFLSAACGGSDDSSAGEAVADAGPDSAVPAAGGAAAGGGASSAAGTSSAGMGGGGQGTGGSNAGGSAGSGGAGAGGAPAECPVPSMVVGRCGDPRPAGAAAPPPPPSYGGGTCPSLVPGRNTITSGGISREFLLVLPSDHDGVEVLPLAFLWHWLGGSADSFLTRGEVQAAADQMRFAAVIPEAKDDPLNVFKWPYAVVESDARQQEEAQFFDDMFACVTEQYPIDFDCVASAGVSAGALWTDQLAGLRGQYLSSIMSLSGGVAGPLIKPWVAPEHKMPAFVLWGGPADVCVTVQFEQTSQNLQAELTRGCHFQIECLHDCAHAEPPFDAPDGISKYSGLWRFFLDHPYWLEPGASVWNRDGLPAGTPEWCSIGPGTATTRAGECPPPACPL